jgi:hypothetical protein
MATPSLFGMLGDEAAMQRQLDEQRAQAFAAQTQEQRLAGMGYQAGAGLGRAVAGMFGADTTDPVVRKASQVRQLASQFDTTQPEGMMKFAQAVQAIDPNLAVQAMEKARQAELQVAEIGKTRAEESKLVQSSQREEQLRAALSGLPPDAGDKEIEAIVRQYGNPDRIFATLEKRQTAEANRIAKAELEREKAEERALTQQRDQEFKQQMAMLSAASKNAMTDLQRQMVQLKIDDLKAKQSDKAEAKLMKEEGAVSHANKVITDVLDAKNLVTGMNTGLIGKGQSFVPGTDAYTLKERIATIKANLGFDRLQQMRDASPTGGALGQVAVQELQALQSSVASLDVGLPKKELDKNLSKIQSHYAAWLKALGREVPSELTQAEQPAATGTWSIKPKQ